jgi:hypothetical protein
MLTTHSVKNGKLIGVTTLKKGGKVNRKIYFKGIDDDDTIPRKPSEKKPKLSRREPDILEGVTEILARPNEIMENIYHPKERITMFIAGAQNCGKSYFVAQLLDDYKHLHPKRPIYLITGLTEKDKHFKKHKLREVILSPETIDSMNLEKLRVDDATGKRTGCLLIFDDTDRIRDKEVMKKVYDLCNDALCNGRDHETQNGEADIDVIVTNHEINDYVRTRGMLTECNYVVIFPYFSLAKQIDLVLDKIGLNPLLKDKIKCYKGRAVIIHKTAPLYCVFKDRLFLLR